MGFAKGDAGAAAGDGAGVDGGEALEDGGGPSTGADGVGDARRVLGDVGGAGDPVVEVGLHGDLVGGGHC